MRIIRFVLLACTLSFAQGCATQISAEKIQNADYGTQPPQNYKEIIAEVIGKSLIDPMSAVYELDEPRKGYTKNSPFHGTTEQFGWRICGTVNSKNRFGGYTGRSPVFILMRGESVTSFIIGTVSDEKMSMSDQMKNNGIVGACNR